MAVWEEHLVDPRQPRVLPGLLERAGFRVVDRQLISLFNPNYEEDSYSAGTTMSSATSSPVGRGSLLTT
ncbi:hypothetical protein ACFPK1_32285 [Actinomycetospora rhizophila]|uniref:Uncharacterized protein n=1 Tax=Actinomycetospora rhizophila TaxID=1416876 RepID=A0ABV9ZR35_9PSEU